MLLIIANKGSFSQSICSSLLRKGFFCKLYCIDKSKTFKETSTNLLKWLSVHLKKDVVIIFISGETREPSSMDYYNYVLPSRIYLRSATIASRFIYLSSLSVFGLPKSSRITPETVRIPGDIYGQSKNRFDIFVSRLDLMPYSVIYPASIVSETRRGIIATISKRFPGILGSAVLALPVSGCLHVCTYEDISDCIQRSLGLTGRNHEIICSKSLSFDLCIRFLRSNKHRHSTIASLIDQASADLCRKKSLPIGVIRLFTLFAPFSVRRSILFSLCKIWYSGTRTSFLLRPDECAWQLLGPRA